MIDIINYLGGSTFRDNLSNPELYDLVKDFVYIKYPKHSLFRSALIVNLYKQIGGKFKKRLPSGLNTWFNEKWVSLNDYLRGDIVKCGESKSQELYNE